MILRNFQGDITTGSDIGKDLILGRPIKHDILLANDLDLLVGAHDIDINYEIINIVGILYGFARKNNLVIDLLLLIENPVGTARRIGRFRCCCCSDILVTIPGQNKLEIRLVVVTFFHTEWIRVVERLHIRRERTQEIIGIFEDIAVSPRFSFRTTIRMQLAAQRTAQGSIANGIGQINACLEFWKSSLLCIRQHRLRHPIDIRFFIGLLIHLRFQAILVRKIHGHLGSEASKSAFGL